MAKPVIEISEEHQKELIDLEQRRYAAKMDEAKAKEERVKLQDQILNHPAVSGKLAMKGVNNLSCGIKITTGVSESWDNEYLKGLDIPENLKPFSFREEVITKEILEISEDGLKYLQQNEPKVYDLVIKGLTTKPKAAQFK